VVPLIQRACVAKNHGRTFEWSSAPRRKPGVLAPTAQSRGCGETDRVVLTVVGEEFISRTQSYGQECLAQPQSGLGVRGLGSACDKAPSMGDEEAVMAEMQAEPSAGTSLGGWMGLSALAVIGGICALFGAGLAAIPGLRGSFDLGTLELLLIGCGLAAGTRALGIRGGLLRQGSRQVACSVVLLCVCSVLLLLPWEAAAADTATATKDSGGTTNSGFFAIGPPGQVVSWSALYLGTPGPEGNGFYLHSDAPGSPQNEITISSSLSPGSNTGTHFLAAGNYEISINYFLMGRGNYAITYNQTATLEVIPPNHHDFGSLDEGAVSAAHLFSIRNTGDLPLTLGTVTNTDSTHFEITDNPSGASLGPGSTADLRVRFRAAASAGPTPLTHSAALAIPASAPPGGPTVSPATATVQGVTNASVPDVACRVTGTENLGEADHTVPETRDFTTSFRNVGTADLVISQVLLVNDQIEAPFSLLTSTATLSATLGPGGSRNVQIRFAPPPAGGERTYTGRIRIDSNDPDEAVKECRFSARAHHRRPEIRLNSIVIDYLEVERGFAFTKPLIIYNDGDAPLHATVALDPSPPASCVDLAHWQPPDGSLELGNVTIASGDNHVFREVYAPQDVGPHCSSLLVTSDDEDPADQSLTVRLQGEGIAPIPLDSVLVLDRSGSMGGNAGSRRKIDAMQSAADLFTHLLALRNAGASPFGDGLGFVKYNHNNSVYLTLDVVVGSHLSDAEDALSDAAIADAGRLLPTGFTGIGGAMETGAGMLVGQPPDRKHVMVVLTDGEQNRTPYVGDVLGSITAADPDLAIYSIGLGSSHNPVVLQDITNVTNGYHQVQDDLSGLSSFDLEAFYFKILANAAGMALVSDPTHIQHLNTTVPQVVDTALISSSDRSAVFVALEIPSLRPYYDLQLIDPHGNVIVPGSAVGGIPVHQLTRMNYRVFRVVFPDKSLAGTYVGQWKLVLTPNGKWNAEEVSKIWEGLHAQGEWINPAVGEAPIGFGAAVRSDYRMAVSALSESYLPGSLVKLTASLTDRRWPSPDGRVAVTVTTPDGMQYPGLELFDDGTHGDDVAGDAVFTTPFVHTALPGSYRFYFQGVGRNERGELNPREDTRYLTLAPEEKEPPAEECLPCVLRWLLWLAVLALLSLLVWCCLRRRG
jgi:hypothetical protein